MGGSGSEAAQSSCSCGGSEVTTLRCSLIKKLTRIFIHRTDIRKRKQLYTKLENLGPLLGLEERRELIPEIPDHLARKLELLHVDRHGDRREVMLGGAVPLEG